MDKKMMIEKLVMMIERIVIMNVSNFLFGLVISLY